MITGRKWQLSAWILILLGSFSLHAQDVQITFEEYKLSNGMHVILHEDHGAPIVVISMLYHVGSKNEDPTRTGFAHFFEHLMFEGSEYIPRGEFDKIVEGSGGYSNAFTTKDQTYYFNLFPSNHLELGLWLESERLLHPRIDQAGVETQREVVKEERRMRYESRPYGTAIEEISKRAYVQHPYRWEPIGSAQYIDQASLEEFMAFHETFYVPENVTMTIVGDITPAETKALIEKYFKDIKRGGKNIPRPTVEEPFQTKEVRDTVFDNIQLPGVFMSYRTPAIGTKDYYALEMISTLLSGGESSRFSSEIVNKQQKAIQATCFYRANEGPSQLLIFTIASNGTESHELEVAVNEEFTKIQEELISEREYQKLLNQIENDFIEGKGSLSGLAESLPYYRVFLGNTNLINTELSNYRSVTREDLQAAAQKYLTRSNRVVIYYLPKK